MKYHLPPDRARLQRIIQRLASKPRRVERILHDEHGPDCVGYAVGEIINEGGFDIFPASRGLKSDPIVVLISAGECRTKREARSLAGRIQRDPQTVAELVGQPGITVWCWRYEGSTRSAFLAFRDDVDVCTKKQQTFRRRAA
jgi:hypothetical protein